MLVGNTARIAGLLCRDSVYRSHDFLDEPEPLVISGEIMDNAILIGRYYLEHAKAALTAISTLNLPHSISPSTTSNPLTQFALSNPRLQPNTHFR